MTPGRLIYDLENFLELLMVSEVALATTKVVAMKGQRGFERITWSNNNIAAGELFRSDSPTVSEYQEWIDCQGYSAVLYEGSFIQLSYDFQHSQMVGHRLLYYPCPFDLEVRLLDTLSLSDLIELHHDQGIESIKLRAPIRFDYDPSTNRSGHPVSHMTILWSHSRIPVTSPVSPGHFFQFVFQNFYPALWSVHSFLNRWPKEELEPTITREEQQQLHLHSYA